MSLRQPAEIAETTINAEIAEIAELERNDCHRDTETQRRFDGRPASQAGLHDRIGSAHELEHSVRWFVCRSESGRERRFATPSNRSLILCDLCDLCVNRRAL